SRGVGGARVARRGASTPSCRRGGVDGRVFARPAARGWIDFRREARARSRPAAAEAKRRPPPREQPTGSAFVAEASVTTRPGSAAPGGEGRPAALATTRSANVAEPSVTTRPRRASPGGEGRPAALAPW